MKFGLTELVIILGIVIILFGPSQIPKLSRMFGEGIQKLRKSVDETDTERQ